MAIERPLASIPAYVIYWDVAIDWAEMENLYGTKDRNLHLDYSTGAVSDKAFLLTMSRLKPTTKLVDKGYWNRVAKTIHTVSVLLVYTVPNQKLMSLHNGLRTLKSEELWAECNREIAQGRDLGLSIFCEAPPTGLCRDFLPVLPEHDVVVFGATVKGDGLKVSNKALLENKGVVCAKAACSEGHQSGQGQPNDPAPAMDDAIGVAPDNPVPASEAGVLDAGRPAHSESQTVRVSL